MLITTPKPSHPRTAPGLHIITLGLFYHNRQATGQVRRDGTVMPVNRCQWLAATAVDLELPQ